MSTIVDRRGKKSGNSQVNSRRRFLNRNRKAVRRAMDKSITRGNITDIGKDGVDVTVPKDDINEPSIHHGQGGKGDRVFPGNTDFQKGDRIPRPPGGGSGQGDGNGNGDPSEPGTDGGGEDEFTFHLSEAEFLEYLFEDLELPNMTKVGDQDTTQSKMVPAGLSTDGPANRLDLPRSVQKRIGRRLSGGKKSRKRILELKTEQRDILKIYVSNDDSPGDTPSKHDGQSGDSKWMPLKTRIKQMDAEVELLRTQVGGELSAEDAERIDEIDKEIEGLERKINAIPSWDEKNDLTYRLNKKEPVPTSKAVMFCLMDVSASMDEETKNKAKLFYFLLHRFLQRHYEQTDIVFIRHHSWAEEVDEETFFYDRETGGTIVSTALETMHEVIEDRYSPAEWNIYGAQATDGDNVGQDNINVQDLLERLMPKVQAYFYTEFLNAWSSYLGESPQKRELWQAVENISKDHPQKLFMGYIAKKSDIWPVFREFFKPREGYDLEDKRQSTPA